ncbi:MAG: hypothetical protein CMH31_03790 [Micavibrio sp.]|nr:hypothetical protein [Micavibrio sp.]|tara:strand:+ start:2798 stop:3295 length:498 start_codon:yes stop_codon:yes gene_type:complete
MLTDFLLREEEAYFNYAFGHKVLNADASDQSSVKKAKDAIADNDYLSRMFGGVSPVFFKERERSDIVGFCVLVTDDQDRMRLTYYVSPSARRNGFTSEAYDAFEANMTGFIGKEADFAEVIATNKASLSFLFSKGFQTVKSISRMDTSEHPTGSVRGKDLLVLRR